MSDNELFKTVKQDDGTVRYEYLISDPKVYEKFGATSVEASLYHFFRPANSHGFNQHNGYLNGYYPYDSQKEAIKVWNINSEEARKHIMPDSLTYTEDEATKIAEINNKCRAKLDTVVSRIICNEESIDNFDKAVKEAKSGGYDELIKIHQTAYDRYIKYTK